MIKVNDLTENQRLIGDSDFEPSINDLDVTDPDENEALYHKVANNKKSHHLEYINGNHSYELVRYGDKYLLLNHPMQSLDYYVNVEEGSFKLLGKWVCQVEVWRDRMSPLRGIVYQVVNGYLLPKYGVLVSDSLQTQLGKELWLRIGTQAISGSYSVYAYDRDANALHHFKDSVDYRKTMGKFYGDSKRFESIRLVISTTPI